VPDLLKDLPSQAPALFALPKALVNLNMFIRTYLLSSPVNRALSELAVLRSLFDQQIRARRGAIAADIERGREDGELHPDADPELLIDTIFAAIFYRLLFRSAPLNERFVEELVSQVFRGVRVQAELLTPAFKRASRTKSKLKDRMDGQLALDEIAKRSV
jgi:hypothetical protein